MKIEQVKKALCCYDMRNPYVDLDPETGQPRSKAGDDCLCSACFRGTHELASYILDLIEPQMPMIKVVGVSYIDNVGLRVVRSDLRERIYSHTSVSQTTRMIRLMSLAAEYNLVNAIQ